MHRDRPAPETPQPAAGNAQHERADSPRNWDAIRRLDERYRGVEGRLRWEREQRKKARTRGKNSRVRRVGLR